MTARLVTITPDCEKTIVWCARESSPNRDNPEIAGLLKYLIKHKHWSPFEMGHAVIEVETSRAIAAQILRHRSFAFQEFSQRYSDDIPPFQYSYGREQAEQNRQSSTETLSRLDQAWWTSAQGRMDEYAAELYGEALRRGIAREQARMLLPLGIGTRLCMAGSIRSWIHYIELRTQEDTQAEHREIAIACKDILCVELPTIATCLNWK